MTSESSRAWLGVDGRLRGEEGWDEPVKVDWIGYRLDGRPVDVNTVHMLLKLPPLSRQILEKLRVRHRQHPRAPVPHIPERIEHRVEVAGAYQLGIHPQSDL